MNPEETKRLLPVIKAFAEGRPIQFRNVYSSGGVGEWQDVDDLYPHRPGVEWRVKPEGTALRRVMVSVDGEMVSAFIAQLTAHPSPEDMLPLLEEWIRMQKAPVVEDPALFDGL